MVRTKADRVPTKAVVAKAPRKVAVSTPSKKSAGSSKGKSYSGGNPYHRRDTPDWQKPITNFFGQDSTTKQNTDPSSTSKVSSAIFQESNDHDAVNESSVSD